MYKRINHYDGNLMAVYKKTKDGIMAVYNDSISIYNFGWDQLTEKEGYHKTTKKVFDKMYNETMEKIKKRTHENETKSISKETKPSINRARQISSLRNT